MGKKNQEATTSEEASVHEEDPQYGIPGPEAAAVLLRQAAKEAFKDGSLKTDQYMKIWRASNDPALVNEIVGLANEDPHGLVPVDPDVPPSGGGFATAAMTSATAGLNWLQLLAMVKKMMPLILELIDIFKTEVPTARLGTTSEGSTSFTSFGRQE